MSQTGKNKDCIHGVKCNVENCIHNNCQTGCTAGKIEVGPTYATTVGDTICRSFKEEQKTY